MSIHPITLAVAKCSQFDWLFYGMGSEEQIAAARLAMDEMEDSEQ